MKFKLLIITTIIVIGIVIRFTNINNFNFHYEQSEDILAAKKSWNAILSGNLKNLELKGQDAFRYKSEKNLADQNIGMQIYHGVIYQYLLIIPGAISNFNPKIIVIFFSIIGSIALIIFSKVVLLKFRNKYVQIFLISIFSFSGWLVLYSRWIWTPSTLIFWSVLTIFLLEKAKKRKKFKYWLGIAFVAGVASQIHISAIILVPAIFFYCYLNNIYFPKKILEKVILLTTFILPCIPLIIYEITNNYPYINTILFFLTHQETKTILNNFGASYKLVEFYEYLFITNFTGREIIVVLTTVILTTTIFFYFYNSTRAFSKKNISIKKILTFICVTLLVIFPLIISKYYSTHTVDIAVINNYIVLFPFLLICIGIFLSQLNKYILTSVFVVFLSFFLYGNIEHIYQRVIENKDGVNYSHKEKLVNEIAMSSGGKNFSLNYINSHSGQFNHSEFLSIFSINNYRLPENLNNQTSNFSGYSDFILNGNKVELEYFILDKANDQTKAIPNDTKLIFDTNQFSLFVKMVEL